MLDSLSVATLAGAVGLGLIHGAEPGHGWPIAATYALEQSNKWLSGFAASFILGVGHLISSIAVVGAFFVLKSGAGLESTWWLDYFAGSLLILLGIHEYRSGHGHDHGFGDESHGADDHTHHHERHEHGEASHSHEHDEDHQSHKHDHAHTDHHSEHADEAAEGWLARVKSALPFGGGHSHDHEELDEAAERGLWSIAGAAFLLGFAHEEEFEIIGLCAGSSLCLELMLIYAAAVIFGIVALTLLLVAGYERYEARVQRWAVHFPTISAAVLILMGLGFIAGVL
jgi:nickel/cobalt exporter